MSKILVGFGSLLRACQEPKGLQNSSQILDAILEAKKGRVPGKMGSAWRNARGSGGKKEGGHKDHLGKNFRKKNLAKNQGLGQEAFELSLARRLGGAADRSAHAARPRSLWTQCCYPRQLCNLGHIGCAKHFRTHLFRKAI